ncbi:MAG: carboxylesterase family protein [Pseudomonadota bacterium]
MKTVLVILVLLGLGFWLWPEGRPEKIQHIPMASTERSTTAGPVIGYEDKHETYAWLGIPFASPPIGDLRWRAPRPVKPWQEPLQATRFNNPCVQLWGPLAGVDGEEGEVVGDEDCLYLNVWSPAVRSTAETGGLPVMLWIHGGGNTIGTANTYDASLLAGGEQLVVVTINYRLGFFGWMSHPALRGQGVSAEDASGNYGNLDMIAALQWVQDNISDFGGDPENVTIFGESAGGRNVYSLMSSSLAQGLFHRAIAQSGSVSSTPVVVAEDFVDASPPGMSNSSGEWLLSQLQLADKANDREDAKAVLQAMSLAEIAAFMHARDQTEVLSGVEGFAGMYSAPQSIRDGAVIPEQSQLALMKSGMGYNAVPLMTGTTRDEAKLFMAQDPRYVKQRLGFIPVIRDLDIYNGVAAYFSDQWRAVAVDAAAEAIAAGGGAPVYAYRWDWDEGADTLLVNYGQLIGAGHGMEVPFVFGDFAGALALPGFYNDDNTPGRDELSQQMRSYWGEFARAGNPGRGREDDLPEWRAWEAGVHNLMLLDTPEGGGVRMVDEPMTVNMIKLRIAADTLLEQEERCALFTELFLKGNSGDDFWDRGEYDAMGCAEYDPLEVSYF